MIFFFKNALKSIWGRESRGGKGDFLLGLYFLNIFSPFFIIILFPVATLGNNTIFGRKGMKIMCDENGTDMRYNLPTTFHSFLQLFLGFPFLFHLNSFLGRDFFSFLCLFPLNFHNVSQNYSHISLA